MSVSIARTDGDPHLEPRPGRLRDAPRHQPGARLHPEGGAVGAGDRDAHRGALIDPARRSRGASATIRRVDTEHPDPHDAEAPIRVVLADDSVLLREGIASLLTGKGFKIVGQCGTAEDLLRKVRSYGPDIAIVDIKMPPTQTDEVRDDGRVEREVLELMAEGLSNSAIAARVFLTERGVEKHVTGIFQKLRLPVAPDTHRRVLAVVAFLQS